jgi:hypothetical protein
VRLPNFDDVLDFSIAAFCIFSVGSLGAAGVATYVVLSKNAAGNDAINKLPIDQKLALVEKRQAYIACDDGGYFSRTSDANTWGDLNFRLAAGTCTVRLGPFIPLPSRPACYPFCRMEEMSGRGPPRQTAG